VLTCTLVRGALSHPKTRAALAARSRNCAVLLTGSGSAALAAAFASSSQSQIKGAQDGIVARRHKRGHVKPLTHAFAATVNCPFAAHPAAVAIKRNDYLTTAASS